MLAQTVGVPDAGALLEVLDRVKSRLPNAAILLGTAADAAGFISWSASPRHWCGVESKPERSSSERRRSSGVAVAARHDGAGRWARVREAGRGDRGGREGDRVGARTEPAGGLMRVLALDYGSAHCGCAVSDPSETIVTPIGAISSPAGRRGLAAIEALIREREVERVVVGLPLSLGRGRFRADARDSGVRAAP